MAVISTWLHFPCRSFHEVSAFLCIQRIIFTRVMEYYKDIDIVIATQCQDKYGDKSKETECYQKLS